MSRLLLNGYRTIEAHAHLGPCDVHDEEITEDQLLNMVRLNELNAVLVQPFPGAPNPRDIHNRIHRLCEQYPGVFYGLASLRPYGGRADYFDEVRRCIEDLGFVGVKLHPNGFPANPLGTAGRMVAQAAAENNVALMIHTGPGLPWAAPSMMIPIAQAFPEMPVVLAHAGWGLFTNEALIVAQTCHNVYLETSWITSRQLLMLVEELGADRIMFGSDVPLNVPTELTKYGTIGLSQGQLEQCLYLTAESVFGLAGVAQETLPPTQSA